MRMKLFHEKNHYGKSKLFGRGWLTWLFCHLSYAFILVTQRLPDVKGEIRYQLTI